MYTVFLKKGEEKRIIEGHPWIFANEVLKIEGKDKQGSIAEVRSFDGRFIGKGYINHASKILIRMLTYKDEEIDYTFFYNRIKQANDYRIFLGYDDNYRVVFGESDLLPALIVDKYSDYLSVQFLSLGMEVRKEMIVDILVKIFSPKGIFERSDVKVREKEGLPEAKGLLYGEIPEKVIINENGCKLIVDIMNGQKTGYFLDQKSNRDNIKYYVKDKTVLDCFCNVGGFSLCAARYGAKEVTSLDISQLAIDTVAKNSELNGFQNIIHPTIGDVFEELRNYKKENKKFDIIILDPPAFTKTVDTVKEGYKGYLDINALALKILNNGGYLITCSCSQHLTLPLFLKMIKESSVRASVQTLLIELRTQGKDHPMLLADEEALYLKVAIIKKL